MTLTVSFTINGAPVSTAVHPETVLADVIRDEFQLVGCKVGCDQAVCGACTVLVDRIPMAACSTFAFEAEGRDIVTIEGLARPDGTLSAVQRAFLDVQGFQCGFCTGGLILLVTALLERDPDPDRATITDWLGSAVCRCTGYLAIIEAVETAARLNREVAA
ncbi:(2Fe-2S)-binding protein [Acuticoccus mangrovi]|uniref:(2Fe-2S)-binding protein n=1 Tax=Acuticoccus mangrovi TaxID=2796142 RepID=A0A934IFN2_9HYPH|nr:(2Fe-2S)-binding protein [Acuticoccus mangrovi]MBJ3775623.1 (2Fe-2S)-binding protein [Acuticoccus mangrovi]